MPGGTSWIFTIVFLPCGYLLETLAVVYHNDASARRQEITGCGCTIISSMRQPVMEQLHDWLKRQFDDKLVEPSS